jgi:hypothetical protein
MTYNKYCAFVLFVGLLAGSMTAVYQHNAKVERMYMHHMHFGHRSRITCGMCAANLSHHPLNH